MKNLRLLLAFFVAATLSVNVTAQTRPAKAPAQAKPDNRPSQGGKAATGRANSADLPNGRASSPPPRPVAQTPARTPGRSIVRNYSVGFHRTDKLLNVGVGLSSYYYGNPIGVSFESGVSDDISVGGQFDYNSGSYNGYYNNYREGYTATYFGLRGSYHANRILNLNSSKTDLYVGIGLGYQSFKWKDSSYGYGYDYNSGLFLNYFIGGKYYFANNIGAFVELGYTGLSSSRIGLSVKF